MVASEGLSPEVITFQRSGSTGISPASAALIIRVVATREFSFPHPARISVIVIACRRNLFMGASCGSDRHREDVIVFAERSMAGDALIGKLRTSSIGLKVDTHPLSPAPASRRGILLPVLDHER